MVCLTSCGSQGLPVYTVGARGWHPDRGLSLHASLSSLTLANNTRTYAIGKHWRRAPAGEETARPGERGGAQRRRVSLAIVT